MSICLFISSIREIHLALVFFRSTVFGSSSPNTSVASQKYTDDNAMLAATSITIFTARDLADTFSIS